MPWEKTTVVILPSLRGSNVNIVFSVGYVRVAHAPAAKFLSPLRGFVSRSARLTRRDARRHIIIRRRDAGRHIPGRRRDAGRHIPGRRRDAERHIRRRDTGQNYTKRAVAKKQQPFLCMYLFSKFSGDSRDSRIAGKVLYQSTSGFTQTPDLAPLYMASMTAERRAASLGETSGTFLPTTASR